MGSYLGADGVKTAEINEAFINHLTSGKDGVEKAAAISSDFLRMKVRESGFTRSLFNPEKVSAEDFTPEVGTDKPFILGEKEPDQPAAITIPFATGNHTNRYIRGRRFRVMLQRIMSPRFQKDVAELATYSMDIRQVLSDNALKDIEYKEDGRTIETVDDFLIAEGATVPDLDEVMWRRFTGGLTRDEWAESRKMLGRATPRFAAKNYLMNNTTIHEFEKWGRDEMGGDYAEQITMNGFGKGEWFGDNLMVTIKQDLVPEGRVYQFAAPDVLGRFYQWEELTMSVSTDNFMVSFYAYEMIGGYIQHLGTIGIAEFGPAP